MIEEFKAFFTVFQQGKTVTNPKAWRDNKAIGNSILALLGALLTIAHGMGYNIEVNQETLSAASTGIVAIVGLVNAVIHVMVSDHVGIKPKS